MVIKKSKTLVIAILVISVFLGIAALGITYYYSTIKDVTPKKSSAGSECINFWVPDSYLKNNGCVDGNEATKYTYGIYDTNGKCAASALPADRPKPTLFLYAGLPDDSTLLQCGSYDAFCKTNDYGDKAILQSAGTANINGDAPAYCACIKDAPTYSSCSTAYNQATVNSCANIRITTNNGLDTTTSPLDPKMSVTIEADFLENTSIKKPTPDPTTPVYVIRINNSKDIVFKSSDIVTGDTKVGGGAFSSYVVDTVSTTVKLADLQGAQNLIVQAFPYDTPPEKGLTVPKACNKSYSFYSAPVPPVSSPTCEHLAFTPSPLSVTLNSTTPPTISIKDLTVNTKNLDNKNDLLLGLQFTGGSDASTSATTKDVKSLMTSSTVPNTQAISLDNTFLYNKDNFSTGLAPTFTLPSSFTSGQYKIKVDATIYSSTTSNPIATCSGTMEVDVNPAITVTPGKEGESCINPTRICDTGLTCGTTSGKCEKPATTDPSLTSNFTVSNTGPTCVERVAPNNATTLTITVRNNDSKSQVVQSVKNKLPLGFTYVLSSTRINGLVVSDSSFVTVTTVGSSQEIVWQTSGGWTVGANSTLEIIFTALAGSDALSGSNQNEVVVTPLNTPIDASTLRTEYVLTVAQNCFQPKTGLFDSTASKLALGAGVLLLSIIFYFTGVGTNLSTNLASSRITKSLLKSSNSFNDSVRLQWLKLTSPREYFEEKMMRDAQKKNTRK